MPTFDEYLSDLVNSLGFGPMTDQSRAGRMGPPNATPGAELRSYEPTAGERVQAAVSDTLRPYLPRLTADRLAQAAGAAREYGPAVLDSLGLIPPAPTTLDEARQGGAQRFVEEAAPLAAAAALGPAGRLIRTVAPRAVPVIAGGGAATAIGASEVGSQDSPVRSLQQMLKERGYYRGPIDGQMGPGTQEAQRRFQEDEARRVQQDNERRQAEAAAKAAEAQAAQAEAQRLETVRQREEAERAAAQRRAGEERLRQIEQDTPWYQRAWRDYGPTAGLVAGFGAGAFTRSYIGKNLEAKARETAERANRLMEAAGRGPVVARISRVNQFWTEGRPGSEAPFVRDPRGSAYPFKINPNAPPAEELYHPSMATRFGPAATVVGGGGVETGFGELLVRGAEEELRNAYAAVQQDPSEANIQRLATARDKLAGYEAIRNAGRGVAVGGIVTEGKSRLTYRHTRPDIATAEAERGAIDRLLLAAKRRKSPIEK